MHSKACVSIHKTLDAQHTQNDAPMSDFNEVFKTFPNRSLHISAQLCDLCIFLWECMKTKKSFRECMMRENLRISMWIREIYFQPCLCTFTWKFLFSSVLKCIRTKKHAWLLDWVPLGVLLQVELLNPHPHVKKHDTVLQLLYYPIFLTLRR